MFCQVLYFLLTCNYKNCIWGDREREEDTEKLDKPKAHSDVVFPPERASEFRLLPSSPRLDSEGHTHSKLHPILFQQKPLKDSSSVCGNNVLQRVRSIRYSLSLIPSINFHNAWFIFISIYVICRRVCFCNSFLFLVLCGPDSGFGFGQCIIFIVFYP